MKFTKFNVTGRISAVSLLILAGCGQPLDFDLRGGDSGTASAVQAASAQRPIPDGRGIISYPSYQVAVAQRGDTVASVAQRVGTDAQALATFNGRGTDDTLREGALLALPNRVAEPEGGPITPGNVDITSLAGSAIADAESTQSIDPRTSVAQSGIEPVRHQVERGETAFTIARLYKVTPRALADWNGLGADFAVNEGQYLLIPVALPSAAAQSVQTTTLTTEAPGQGSPTPLPPSASTPLPEEETVAAAEPVEVQTAPDLGAESAPKTSEARMVFPVKGEIIREYSKGKNDGIDIAAAPGSPVVAADSGTVAAITEDTNGVPIIVMKHTDNVLTVYSNVGNLAVKKGDSVNKGGKLAEIREDGAAAVHFEVREGFDSVDPIPYLN
ncbi:MAG: peptidoglycan DD-metalloendopeptidase family protein [Pseudomonadota bacterium]